MNEAKGRVSPVAVRSHSPPPPVVNVITYSDSLLNATYSVCREQEGSSAISMQKAKHVCGRTLTSRPAERDFCWTCMSSSAWRNLYLTRQNKDIFIIEQVISQLEKYYIPKVIILPYFCSSNIVFVDDNLQLFHLLTYDSIFLSFCHFLYLKIRLSILEVCLNYVILFVLFPK